jgi:hypothetical protein
MTVFFYSKIITLKVFKSFAVSTVTPNFKLCIVVPTSYVYMAAIHIQHYLAAGVVTEILASVLLF